jgi:hypothetical protein
MSNKLVDYYALKHTRILPMRRQKKDQPAFADWSYLFSVMDVYLPNLKILNPVQVCHTLVLI